MGNSRGRNYNKLLGIAFGVMTLAFLILTFWERSLFMGISVLALIAVAKMTWSVIYGGESGKSIFIPAV